MSTRTLLGTLLKSNGTPWAGVEVKVSQDGFGLRATAHSPGTITKAVTNTDGDWQMTLQTTTDSLKPIYYRYHPPVETPSLHTNRFTPRFSLAPGAQPVRIETVLALGLVDYTPDTTTLIQAAIDAAIAAHIAETNPHTQYVLESE